MQFGLTPDKIGIVFLANAIPYAACAPLSGLLADKIVSVRQIFNLKIHWAWYKHASFTLNIFVCRIPDSLLCVAYLLLE